jgi:hypothetical protein
MAHRLVNTLSPAGGGRHARVLCPSLTTSAEGRARTTRRHDNAISPAGRERRAGVRARNDAVACKRQHRRSADSRGTVTSR